MTYPPLQVAVARPAELDQRPGPDQVWRFCRECRALCIASAAVELPLYCPSCARRLPADVLVRLA